MRRFLSFLTCLLLLILVLCRSSLAQIAVDDPEDEERLNRELWESIKKTPYAAVVERLARTQKTAQTGTMPDLTLPNGWKLAPAGSSVAVGRFPYEAIAYAGKIVVRNTGYYTGKDKPEVSIVEPSTQQVSPNTALRRPLPVRSNRSQWRSLSQRRHQQREVSGQHSLRDGTPLCHRRICGKTTATRQESCSQGAVYSFERD